MISNMKNTEIKEEAFQQAVGFLEEQQQYCNTPAKFKCCERLPIQKCLQRKQLSVGVLCVKYENSV